MKDAAMYQRLAIRPPTFWRCLHQVELLWCESTHGERNLLHEAFVNACPLEMDLPSCNGSGPHRVQGYLLSWSVELRGDGVIDLEVSFPAEALERSTT